MHFNALVLAVILFCLGIVGIISRRNIFVLYMSVELMLNGINLGFVTASSLFAKGDSQVIAILVMAIAAAEAALFLAMIVVLFRSRHTVDTGQFTLLAAKESHDLG